MNAPGLTSSSIPAVAFALDGVLLEKPNAFTPHIPRRFAWLMIKGWMKFAGLKRSLALTYRALQTLPNRSVTEPLSQRSSAGRTNAT